MQDQVADAVAVRKRIAPKLFFGERIDPFVKIGGSGAIFSSESGGDSLR